jgi:hypothetical protein
MGRGILKAPLVMTGIPVRGAPLRNPGHGSHQVRGPLVKTSFLLRESYRFAVSPTAPPNIPGQK